MRLTPGQEAALRDPTMRFNIAKMPPAMYKYLVERSLMSLRVGAFRYDTKSEQERRLKSYLLELLQIQRDPKKFLVWSGHDKRIVAQRVGFQRIELSTWEERE